MKKEGLVVLISLILSLFLITGVLAVSTSADSEIKTITHYAEEYETGNIDYVRLLVYISASRQNLNELLGATEPQMGGVLKQEKIREILGEPTEETKWVWSEGEEQDKKLDSSVPAWKKIIFDGKKIQISLDAWPSLFTKKQFDNEGNNKDKEIKEESNKEGIKEGDLVYRLNFWIEFKKPEEQLNIGGKIDDIKSLAEKFNSDPSQENAETLAKETVNAEKTFESYFRQNQGKCEDLMSDIFGSENQMPNQNMFVQEISFYEGEKLEVIARLEMCDDCEWNWINLNFDLRTRGPMPKMEQGQAISIDQFKDKDTEYYKSEVIRLLEDYKKAAAEQNWKEVNTINQKIWAINEAWNQKANDVWKEFEKNNFAGGVENQISENDNSQPEITGSFITGNVIEENNQQEQKDPYFWIKQDQERRKQEKALRQQNYQERKQFYLDLFSGYEKKEYSFTQVEFKKRLIELFKEKGEEICSNNQDDNKDEKIDCDDDQCSGKICGKGTGTITEGNETKETEIDFYCIAGECRAKEVIVKIKQAVCGDHVCEGNESIENCAEDCASCPQYPPLECAGKVIFSGVDENNCSLAPTCIEEETCTANEDCKFLCGTGECVEGKCQVKELSECSEQECDDGTQKTLNCESGESIISSTCSNGLWIDTELACPGTIEGTEVTEEEIIIGEEVIGDQCTARSDCGGESDVCSNGECVAIPEKIEIEEPEEEEKENEERFEEEPEEEEKEKAPETETETTQPEETTQEAETEQTSEPEPEPPVTGEVIFGLFRSLLSRMRITGAAITGFEVEEGDSGTTEPAPEEAPSEDTGEQETSMPDEPEPGQEGNQQPAPEGEPGMQPEQQYDNQQYEDNRDDEGREDNERRKEEQEKRCTDDCNRPCIEKCIRENCGEELDCSVDEESKKCEGGCTPENACIEKCMTGGEDWWKEFENKEEFKEQTGGFEAGGNCRTAKGKTEGFIWFGGWGNPFEKIQAIKNKYYSGGNADWCKIELQNLIKQREEFEKGFNQEFAKWFFEDYLANSAENWEQAVSGIFELYWKNVDTQRELAFRMKCLEETDINKIMTPNLINIIYETEYGKLEYWEEIKTVKVPGMDGEVTIISPYMKTWIFPSKQFIEYEMKKAMKNHEFPGSPEDKTERKNEEGMTAQEKEMLKQDEKFMKSIKTIAEKYGGSLDAVVQFRDLTNNEVIFNVYAQVNENDIIKITPMLPEEVPEKDVVAEIDFEKIYELIYSQEKEMRGEQIQSPPWDQKMQPVQRIKDVVNGAKMYLKVRSIMNSATFTPAESEDDMKRLFKKFFSMMNQGDKNEGGQGSEQGEKENAEQDTGTEQGVWEDKEVLTGEVISYS